MARLITAAFAALQFISGAWAADVAPPAWPAERHAVPNARMDPVGTLRMGTLEVVPEKTTLKAVIDATGAGEIDATEAEMMQKSEPADSLSWVCYTISGVHPAQRIWLTSSGMGEGTVINGIAATQLSPAGKAVPECPELPAKFKPVRFANDLWLGSSSGEIEAVLGEPAKRGDTWSYFFRGIVRDADLVASLRVKFVGGKAAAIAASRAAWKVPVPPVEVPRRQFPQSGGFGTNGSSPLPDPGR